MCREWVKKITLIFIGVFLFFSQLSLAQDQLGTSTSPISTSKPPAGMSVEELLSPTTNVQETKASTTTTTTSANTAPIPTPAPSPDAVTQAPSPFASTLSFSKAPPGSTSPSVAPPSVPQTEVSQFQKWLQNNGPPKPITPPDGKHVLSKHKHKIKIQTGPDAPLVESPPISYHQSQEIMLEAAPKSPPPSPEANAAFNAMLQQNMPLTPQQVVRLRQLIDNSQRAASIPATIPPKPVSSTLMINLAPGATPPAIRLAQGYVSSLVFVDSTGAPWPLASYDIGDPKATNIQWDGKSNIVLIQAVSPYSEGNMVVRLVGLATPISLILVSGQRVVDYRTDIHVAGLGPNTKDLPIGTTLPESANQLLLNVLDGVAPAGSRLLTVKGGDCQGWLLGDKMYLRTRFTVLSPGWTGRMVSPDGMIAYEIQKTSSVLISQYGNPVELKVEGF